MYTHASPLKPGDGDYGGGPRGGLLGRRLVDEETLEIEGDETAPAEAPARRHHNEATQFTSSRSSPRWFVWRPPNAWTVLAAATLVQACGGLTYSFSVYSADLRNVYPKQGLTLVSFSAQLEHLRVYRIDELRLEWLRVHNCLI